MRHKAIAVELALQRARVFVQNGQRLAIQIDVTIEDRLLERVSVSGQRMRVAHDVFGDSLRRLLMNGAEKNHVPIIRELIAENGKPGVELRSQHGVIFKNQHARPRLGAGLLNPGEMTAQAAIGAGKVVPRTWNGHLAAVRRGKTDYPLEIVFG